jgi:hypothetical protein
LFRFDAGLVRVFGTRCSWSEGMTRLAFISLFLIIASRPAAADALTGTELRKILIGHTWSWNSKKFETSGVTTYFRDGKMIAKIDGWGDRPEWGRWQIKENQICTTLLGNRESCSDNIIQIDDRTLFSESTETTFVRSE